MLYLTAACLALAPLLSCGGARKTDGGLDRVALEAFVVAPGVAGEPIRYVRRVTDLPRAGGDPDAVARKLTEGIGAPAILHSTSWRWERDGTIVLTYLAYCERADFGGNAAAQLPWDQLAQPSATDPQKPRPAEIREQDVVSHGLRHLSFLIRYARDGRLSAALSPRSQTFFQALCGQLAGRIEAAREFEECAAVGAR